MMRNPYFRLLCFILITLFFNNPVFAKNSSSVEKLPLSIARINLPTIIENNTVSSATYFLQTTIYVEKSSLRLVRSHIDFMYQTMKKFVRNQNTNVVRMREDFRDGYLAYDLEKCLNKYLSNYSSRKFIVRKVKVSSLLANPEKNMALFQINLRKQYEAKFPKFKGMVRKQSLYPFDMGIVELEKTRLLSTTLNRKEICGALAKAISLLATYQDNHACGPWETCGFCKNELLKGQKKLAEITRFFPDIFRDVNVSLVDEAYANKYINDVNAACRRGEMPDHDGTIRFLRSAAKVAERLGNIERLNLLRIMLADAYIYRWKIPEGQRQLDLVKQQVSPEDKVAWAYITMEEAKLQYIKKNSAEAIDLFEKAYEQAKSLGLRLNERKAAVKLSVLFEAICKKTALDWMEKALKTFTDDERVSDEKYWAISSFADLCENLGDFETSLKIRKSYYELRKDEKDIAPIHIGLTVGTTLRKMGRMPEAIEWFENLKEKNALYGNNYCEGECNLEIGLALFALKQFDNAKPFLLNARPRFVELADQFHCSCQSEECPDCAYTKNEEAKISKIDEMLKQIESMR